MVDYHSRLQNVWILLWANGNACPRCRPRVMAALAQLLQEHYMSLAATMARACSRCLNALILLRIDGRCCCQCRPRADAAPRPPWTDSFMASVAQMMMVTNFAHWSVLTLEHRLGRCCRRCPQLGVDVQLPLRGASYTSWVVAAVLKNFPASKCSIPTQAGGKKYLQCPQHGTVAPQQWPAMSFMCLAAGAWD